MFLAQQGQPLPSALLTGLMNWTQRFPGLVWKGIAFYTSSMASLRENLEVYTEAVNSHNFIKTIESMKIKKGLLFYSHVLSYLILLYLCTRYPDRKWKVAFANLTTKFSHLLLMYGLHILQRKKKTIHVFMKWLHNITWLSIFPTWHILTSLTEYPHIFIVS